MAALSASAPASSSSSSSSSSPSASVPATASSSSLTLPPTISASTPPLEAAANDESVNQLEQEVSTQRSEDAAELPSKRKYVLLPPKEQVRIAKAAMFDGVNSTQRSNPHVSHGKVSSLKREYEALYRYFGETNARRPGEDSFQYDRRLRKSTEAALENACIPLQLPETRSTSHRFWSAEAEETAAMKITALRAVGDAVDLRLARTILFDAVAERHPIVVKQRGLTMSQPTV
jgi:hypothetical protein